jgi:hypothetical protein
MPSRVSRREQEEHPKRHVDAENHVEVGRLFRLPGPSAWPDSVQDRKPNHEDEAEEGEGAAQEPGIG